jgi:hypothetical protein
MPCACRVPFELYPDASEWGPLLWTALHGLAERSGSPTAALFAEDERRAWIALFKATGDIIPCPVCKEHFQDYFKEHPIEELKTIPIYKLHDWVRDWFWEVHNWVNITLGKPEFPKEDLATKFGKIPLRQVLNSLDIPMNRAIVLSGTKHMKFKEWKGKYVMILGILGI